MNKWRIPAFVCGRWPALLLGLLLTALVAFCLVALVSAEAPAMSVSKTASPEVTYPDTPIQYTVRFTNNTGTAQEIEVISDTLPADFRFLGVTAGSDIIIHDPPPPGTTGTFVCSDLDPDTLLAGETLSLIYGVVADAPTFGSYDNHFKARLGGGQVIEGTATVTLLGVDLHGEKTASVEQVRVGGTLVYEVSLWNTGNTAANLSSILDTLPPDFSFVEMVEPVPDGLGPLTVDGRELRWTDPDPLLAGGTLTFRYRVRAGGIPGQRPRNSVLATYGGQTAGPFSDEVLLLEETVYVYLPLIRHSEEPEPPPVPYRLAYDSYTGGSFEILAIDATGSNRLNVSNRTGGDLDPDWSPDGARLAWVHFYDGKGDIVASNADGTGWVNLTNHEKEDRAPAWSPDGTKIAFHSLREESKWQIYTMNTDGSGVTRLTYHQCQSHDPVWSPDGTRIAYVCGIDEYADVFVMNADGSNPIRLTQNDVPDEALDWSPDGTRIAYVRYNAANRQTSDIWVVTVATGTSTRLTSTEYADYSPAWSPDGSRIAFSTYLNGTYDIALMDPNGGNVVNLTQAVKGDFVPRWSPDGTKIAFLSTRDNDRALYVMNADGSGQTRLDFIADSTDKSVHIPAWKPQ